MAFAAFEEVTGGRRWAELAFNDATVQRPLWASTGVKNPDYPDTMYVSELVTSGTVNTVPSTTLGAMGDHGKVLGDTVRTRYSSAADIIGGLNRLGVNLDAITERLEKEGLAKFEASWAELTVTVAMELDKAARHAPTSNEGSLRPGAAQGPPCAEMHPSP